MTNTALIFTSLVLAIAIAGFLVIAYIKKLNEQRDKELKSLLSSITALNVSHLHDAANFFGLVNSSVNDLEINDDKKRELSSFARGASYHFRTLFDELKTSVENFEKNDLSEIVSKKYHLLYKLETIDLKDLLELELFQLSQRSRLVFEDKTFCEHALIKGNFNLLSKGLLNLLENALKYTQEDIKVELSEKSSMWQIRISSFGKSIPFEIAESINKNANTAGEGHGLNSLMDIINFHGASLSIDTIASEGVSINIKFDKYSQKQSVGNKHNIHQIQDQALKNLKKFSTKKKSKTWVFILSILISLGLLSSMMYQNHQSCKRYFDQKTQVLAKAEFDLTENTKMTMTQDFLEQVDFIINNGGELNEIKTLELDFIEKIDESEKAFVSFLIFNYVKQESNSNKLNYLRKEANSLLSIFPENISLNWIVLNKASRTGTMKPLKLIKSSLRLSSAYFNNFFYLSPEDYTMNRIESKFNDKESLIKLIANSFSSGVLLEQDLKTSSQSLITPRYNNSKKEITKINEKSSKKFNELNSLIDKANQDLGLDYKGF